MDLNEKLVNVRRAVRLLAGYHARLLDLLQMAHGELEAVPGARMRFERWEPVHHAHVDRSTKNPLGRWGWDFVPLQNTYFQWTTDGAERPVPGRNLAVVIQHLADTGYTPGPGHRGPDPATFREAAECDTVLQIIAYGLVRGTFSGTWLELDDALVKVAPESQLWDGEVHMYRQADLAPLAADAVLRNVGWEVSLRELATEQEVVDRLLEPLRRRTRALLAPVEGLS